MFVSFESIYFGIGIPIQLLWWEIELVSVLEIGFPFQVSFVSVLEFHAVQQGLWEAVILWLLAISPRGFSWRYAWFLSLAFLGLLELGIPMR